MDNISKTFCTAPWVHAYANKIKGKRKLCCNSVYQNDHDTSEVTDLEQWWNDDYMKSVRRRMLNGETLPECKICDPNDKKSITAGSYKDMWNEAYKDYIKTILENTTPDGETSLSPTSFHYELSNLCNFACRMCSVEWASKIEAEAKKHENYPLKRYERRYLKADHQNMIKPWQKRLEDELWKSVKDKTLTNIYFAGGEPLMWDIHWKVLTHLVESGHSKNVWIRYNTNLSRMHYKDYDLVELLKQFKRVDIGCSIDGGGPVGEYVRTGLVWEQWKENFKKLYQLRLYDKSRFQIHLETTITTPGLFGGMSELINFALEQDAKIRIHRAGPVEPDNLICPSAVPRSVMDKCIDDIILNVKQKNIRDSNYVIKQLLSIKNKPVYEEEFKNYDIDLRRGKEKVEFIENIRKGLTLKEIIKNSNNQKALEWYINI